MNSCKLEGSSALVCDAHGTCDNVKIVECSINKDCFHSEMLVEHGYFKSFSLVFLSKCCRHTLKLRLALVDLMRSISQVAGGHSVIVHHHKAWLTVIACSEAWIFHRQNVHK